MRRILMLMSSGLLVLGLAAPAFADEARPADRDRHEHHGWSEGDRCAWRHFDEGHWRHADRDDRCRFHGDDWWRARHHHDRDHD
jgi:hypothetical protein